LAGWFIAVVAGGVVLAVSGGRVWLVVDGERCWHAAPAIAVPITSEIKIVLRCNEFMSDPFSGSHPEKLSERDQMFTEQPHRHHET
jgi:hypothetical protein